MKKIIFLIAVAMAALVGVSLSSCSDDDTQKTWEAYKEWRDINNQWLNEMIAKKNADGSDYYKTVVPAWYPSSFVLLHYFNDPAENADKLSPLYNSTVDVRYYLHLYDGTPVDSSVNVTAYGTPGVYRTNLQSNILGWAMALENVHCGDSVEVIVPYQVGYGNTGSGVIPPYTNLRFNIRLVDIPFYELPEN